MSEFAKGMLWGYVWVLVGTVLSWLFIWWRRDRR